MIVHHVDPRGDVVDERGAPVHEHDEVYVVFALDAITLVG